MRYIDFDYSVCDLVLDMLDNMPGGFVSFEQLRQAVRPANEDEVYSFLVAEGLLEETRHGYQITHKGRIVIHGGGFKKRLRRERLVFVCSIIAAVSGVIAAIASIASLFL